MIKRVFRFIVPILIYFSIAGFAVPFIVIKFGFYDSVYALLEELASKGFFFFLYLMSNFFFFPFIYSTLIKGRLSFNISKQSKKRKNQRRIALILFVFGIPLIIWCLFGLVGYYSITEFSGGMGQLVHNGFLVLIIILMYFCLFPAIILGLKKNRF